MALSNLANWSRKNTAATVAFCGSACGASDKPTQQPTSCGSACGAGDKPIEQSTACGSACGAGDKQ